MPKIAYISENLQADTLAMIVKVNKVVDSFRAQGFRLTLRQIYYQLVATDQFPEDRKFLYIPETKKWVRDPEGTKNAEPNYKWLGGILEAGRMNGLIDWSAILDRGRQLIRWAEYNDPADRIQKAVDTFQIDKWRGQPYRVEVWIEKQALEEVFQRICGELQVPLMSCKGYSSLSAMWEAAQRLIEYAGAQDQTPVILHFGDHDPSGVDMTRDICDRLKTFRCDLKLERLALNMKQIRQHKPPPQPAKSVDPRFKSYLAEYGKECWELDALNPATLATLVRNGVYSFRDADLWAEKVAEEEEYQQQMNVVADRWDDIVEFLNK